MQAVEWTGRSLRYLDQTALPVREAVAETTNPREVFDAIRLLAIRGAPLIGIAAAYSAVLECRQIPPSADRPSTVRRMTQFLDEFGAVRPTAVNLQWALKRMARHVQDDSWSGSEELARVLEREARAIHEEDRRSSEAIAVWGAPLIPEGAGVLTHCNTGFLATGGDGTALNVIRRAHALGRVRHVYVDETRPLLQGSRLTAWELRRLGIPHSILVDSAAASLMARGLVGAVVVGADRIAANGDVANKIGTYSLAIAAHHHAIPMIVAAPSSTFDRRLATGSEIPIEEREGSEITRLGAVQLAPEGTETTSPAFDVTPSELISAIVTEQGVLRPPLGKAIGAFGGAHKP